MRKRDEDRPRSSVGSLLREWLRELSAPVQVRTIALEAQRLIVAAQEVRRPKEPQLPTLKCVLISRSSPWPQFIFHFVGMDIPLKAETFVQ
jgi:hypothetical protein